MIAARAVRPGYGTDSESESRHTFRDGVAMRPMAIKITTTTQVDHPPPSPVYEISSKPSDLEIGENHDLDK